MSRDDETQRCETDAIYRMLSERPTSCDATDAAAAAAGRDAEFDRTQMEAASLQLQVLPSSQVSDSGRYCTSEGVPVFTVCLRIYFLYCMRMRPLIISALHTYTTQPLFVHLHAQALLATSTSGSQAIPRPRKRGTQKVQNSSSSGFLMLFFLLLPH